MPHAMQAANRHARTDTAASDTQSRVTTCETFTVRALSQNWQHPKEIREGYAAATPQPCHVRSNSPALA